jgi:hypothetical protein
VLEPSAGTGQLAVFAEASGAALALNELGDTRADLLALLFADTPVSRCDAEQIHDLLPDGVHPSVVLMNPPFSASPNVLRSVAGTDMRHIRSALSRLLPGGRLVAITGAALSPDNPDYSAAFAGLAQMATLQFSCAISGKLYRRHGTTVETRLTVFDRVPAPAGHRPLLASMADTVRGLHDLVAVHVPPRLTVERPKPVAPLPVIPSSIFTSRPVPARPSLPPRPTPITDPGVPLAYTCIDDQAPPAAVSTDNLYEPYAVETIRIEGAKPHPTQLVQSAAMASVRPPKPTYRPILPTRIVSQGLLSDAQLESLVYAGEAHAAHLAGRWSVNESFDVLSRAADDDVGAIAFRRGWFLGDGTGAGKGRQVAGIVLDNWLHGRRRALWISKSDKLIEDAQRDWSALGQEKLLIVPQDRYRQGKPIRFDEGILFTTYATLRSAEREGKASRLQQILDWLGKEFDGVIVFDEAHAMANAAGGSSERSDRAPSQQGLAGLRLQHALPNARVVYCSATGATAVENLAYAQRLGIWGGDDFPFPNRSEFVNAMQQGGIASMEVLARDLKALGLYTCRALSYEGVEVDILEHALTPEQIRIYDEYAVAFQVIHRNLDEALKAAKVTGEDGGTQNKVAKAAARSAFESSKQRFFNHLITAMKVATLIRAIEADLETGKAAIVQLVSTSEALMERRLAQIPASEWGDLSVDITPREYVLDYLAHGFPTQLYETYSDDKGNILSRPMFKDGQPVHCKEAQARRDRMIEKLAALPPVQAALDQIVHHFGTDVVAEVTGRGRRIVRKDTVNGPVLCVVNRAGSANLAETQAFMDDKKRVLVFSDAGGTGRSYHADLACLNQRPRVHYLLEAGWKADTAIQGLGRSNRTNQKQPPLFRPVATDVRGEKRFLSTIARRLDSLGAITRGQRQTGGQGMFRPEDNLESVYARAALRNFYGQIYRGQVGCCSLQKFIEATGLNLLDGDGSLREELPPITTFLNRMLALQIGLQNALFEHFEGLLAAQVEGAIAAGTHDVGLETIRAESLVIAERHAVGVHATGAETQVFAVNRKDRNRPMTVTEALELVHATGALMVANTKSGRAALQVPAASWTLEDGAVERRVKLIRPTERMPMPFMALEESNWERTGASTFAALWTREVDAVPEFTSTRFHIITGLLLPIWKKLPADHPRVYRFVTDSGERVIGRLIPPELLDLFAVPTDIPTPDQAFQRLITGRTLKLSDGLTLRQVNVMHARRIELTGFSDGALDSLKAKGLTSEIIAWKTRLFVPTDAKGPRVLARLMAQHPPVQTTA